MSFRLAASYVDRILKGEKPADLPVQAPVNYELGVSARPTGGPEIVRLSALASLRLMCTSVRCLAVSLGVEREAARVH